MDPISGIQNAALPPDLLKGIQQKARNLLKGGADAARVEEAAKDFEALMIHQLFKEVQRAMPEGGLFQDATTKQIQDMFWHFLADEMADKGGFGMWKQLYTDFAGRLGADENEAQPSMELLR